MNNNQLNQQSSISQESQQPQPSLQPEIPKKQGLPTWAIILIVVGAIIVLAGASYGVYWFFTSQPAEPLPADQGEITPGQLPTGELDDETADWQTYRNEDLGFEIKIPPSANVDKIFNDDRNRLVVFENGNEDFEVRLKDGEFTDLDYYYYLDFPVAFKATLGEKEALVFEAPNGYCDGPSCGNPFIAYSAKLNNNFYNLIFYGDTELTDIERLILNSFKFIEADKTADWQTYQNKGYGYEIKCPKDWLLGAVNRGDMGGGLFDVSQEWTIEPAPIFEVRPEDSLNLSWIIKDNKGVVQFRINKEYKSKFGNISLEQFAQDYPTPKDKITNLVSEKIIFNGIEMLKQSFDISDSVLKSGFWYYISSDEYFFIFISRDGADINLIEQILSTFKFID